MTMRTVNIAKDFSPFPAGRFKTDGPFPGEAFRQKFLVPALAKGDVMVVLDGTAGYGSSFLEEAFGGLVRLCGFTQDDLRKHLSFESVEDPSYVEEIWQYIDDATPDAK